MAILVTGGSGFIGSRVVGLLEDKGEQITIFDMVKHESAKKSTSAIVADVNDLNTLSRTLKENDISTVMHLVGLPLVSECEKNPQLSYQLNTLSTQSVVEAMRRADVKKVVFASSACVYGYQKKERVSEQDLPNPDSIYAFHKLLSEAIIKSYHERYGINFVILRPFNVYGVEATYGKDVLSIFIRRVIDRKPLHIMGPNKFRDFIHINDIINAFDKACVSNLSSSTINIGSGVKLSLGQLGAIFKSEIPDVKVIEEKTSDDGTGLYAEITLAKEALGLKPIDPTVGIAQFIKHSVERQWQNLLNQNSSEGSVR